MMTLLKANNFEVLLTHLQKFLKGVPENRCFNWRASRAAYVCHNEKTGFSSFITCKILTAKTVH